MAQDVGRDVSFLIGNSLNRKKASMEEEKSLKHILTVIEADWRAILAAIGNHPDSDFKNPNPETSLASIIAEIRSSNRTWNQLRDLAKAEGKNLSEIGKMADEIIAYFNSTIAAIAAGKFASRTDLFERVKGQLSAINRKLDEKIKKEIELDRFISGA